MCQAVTGKNTTTFGGRDFKGETSRLRVAHVLLSLDVGGLERNVLNQVREGQALGQEVSVVCVTQPGVLASQVESLGGRLFWLHKRPGIKLATIVRMRNLFLALKPEIVHTHQIGTLFYAGPTVASLGRVQTKLVHTERGREPYPTSARRRWLGRLADFHVAPRRFDRALSATPLDGRDQRMAIYRTIPTHQAPPRQTPLFLRLPPWTRAFGLSPIRVEETRTRSRKASSSSGKFRLGSLA